MPHLRREIFKALKPHHVDDCPFVDLPNPKSSRWGGGVTADEMREMQWVRPELVAQIRFVEWTAEGRLRHAAFLGLRSDKSAREVRRRTRPFVTVSVRPRSGPSVRLLIRNLRRLDPIRQDRLRFGRDPSFNTATEAGRRRCSLEIVGTSLHGTTN